MAIGRVRAVLLLIMVGLGASLGPLTALAKTGSRSISYSYFQAECFMWVTVAETSSGPQGEVALAGIYGEQPRRKPFRISQAEFNGLWDTLNAPGVAKQLIRPGQRLGDSYIFNNGEQR